MPAGELRHEADRSLRPGETERDDPISGRGLDRVEARALELAAQELLEPGGGAGPRRPRAGRVQPRDVGLRGDEQAGGPARPEEVERDRPLRRRAHRVHPCAGERRELRHDGGDLFGGEGHGGALSPKCCGRPEAAAALNARELSSYFLLFFFVVFFFAAGFFVAFFLAAIGAPSSERPFDSDDTFGMDKLDGG